jgi:hypothetical protein
VNPAELRYQIVKLLNQAPGMQHAELVSPEPDKPLAILVTTTDPYARPQTTKARRYRVTIEEEE